MAPTIPFIGHLSLDAYNALPAERYSHLKHLHKSPRHYQHAVKSDDQTAAMVRGDATHAAILEPERFASEYLVYPGAVRRGKEWEHWAAKHEGATIITQTEREAAIEIAAAVREDPIAARLLEQGEAEVTMYWDHSGTPVKARADWITGAASGPVVVGIKTAKQAGPRLFGRQAADLLYSLQWAMYREGYHACRGEWPAMLEIVVEAGAPHDVVVYSIPEQVIIAGQIILADCMNKLSEARRTGVYHGQGGGKVIELELPLWAPGMDDEDDGIVVERRAS